MNKVRLDKLKTGSFFTSNVANDINMLVSHNKHTSDVYNYAEKTIHELPSDVFVTPHFNTVKIGDIEDACSDPQHNPPSHMVLEPGVYQHTCPNCGNVIKFTVPKITI